MSNELAVQYKVDGEEITLNPGVVLNYLIDDKNMSNISNKEMARVIMTMKARNLNPFTGDVVIQPRKNKDGSVSCSMVTTKDFFTRRAEANPRYRGKKAGICVISHDGRPVKRQGSAVYHDLGERLIGGWCEVYIEGRDEPEYSEVSLSEYNEGYALWKTKPATMIRKVAVSQALREAFPNDFNGLYEPEEMGYETESKAKDEYLESISNAKDHELIDVLLDVLGEASELGILVDDPKNERNGLTGYIRCHFGKEPVELNENEATEAIDYINKIIGDKRILNQDSPEVVKVEDF